MYGAELLARLREGPLIGTFVKLPRPEVVQVLAQKGLNFVICDLEHAQMDERDAWQVVLAGRAVGLPVVVRVATPDRGLINRLLECGAAGIQLPRVTGSEHAREFRRLLSYPPVGSRSVSQAQPAAAFGSEPLPDYLTRSNAEVFAVGQFESAGLDDTLDDAVQALDVAFIGTVDLSVDLERPGHLGADEVRSHITRVEQACGRTGTPLGIFAASSEVAVKALAAGYRYIAVGSDLAMLGGGAERLASSLRSGRAAS